MRWLQLKYNILESMKRSKGEQMQSQQAQAQLQALEEELRNKIEEAKTIARQMKTSLDNDEQYFSTNQNGELVYPEFHNQTNYNEEFWKTYLKNQLSFSLVKDLSERTSQLQDLVKEIQSMQENYFTMFRFKNRKKNRRLAIQIQKKYDCPYEKCYKVYGSDVSLNLHIKLKHNGGNKTDREKLAEQIIFAEQNGLPPPEMRYNLPPGFLEEFKKSQKINSMKEQPKN